MARDDKDEAMMTQGNPGFEPLGPPTCKQDIISSHKHPLPF